MLPSTPRAAAPSIYTNTETPRWKNMWLTTSNLALTVVWIRVLGVFFFNRSNISISNSSCKNILTPVVRQALLFSFLEIINCLMGVTSSNAIQVLLFAVVRWGVESIVAPRLPCGAWQHLLTVFCWSLGEVTRFGCFLVDGLLADSSARWAKSIRYTVGPLLFPLGAFGEMLMVLRVARGGRPAVYLAAALWPVGFYPLMKQLLRQRRKFFQPLTPRGAKEIKAV